MAAIAVPLKLDAGGGNVLSFISTITVFGTPVDVTLSELALETFFPADDFTAQALRGQALRAQAVGASPPAVRATKAIPKPPLVPSSLLSQVSVTPRNWRPFGVSEHSSAW